MSGHTSRVHFLKQTGDGRAEALGLSLPMEALLLSLEEEDGAIGEAGNNEAAERKALQGEPRQGTSGCGAAEAPSPSAARGRERWAQETAARLLGEAPGDGAGCAVGRCGASVVGEAVRLLGPRGLARALLDAAALAAEWMELRPIERQEPSSATPILPSFLSSSSSTFFLRKRGERER